MEAQVFENYLRQVRELISQQEDNSEIEFPEVIQLIEQQKEISAGNNSDEAFLKGELHFYSGEYEQSLKHYLDAKEIPCFQFFCYRASCLVSYERGQHEKAFGYAEKALKLDAEDPIVRRILALRDSSSNAQGNENYSHSEVVNESFSNQENHSIDLLKENSQEYALQTAVVEEAVQNCIQKNSEDSALVSMTNFSQKYHPLERASRMTCDLEVASQACPESLQDHTRGLEERIRLFQNSQTEGMQSYLQQTEKNHRLEENALYVLNGWPAYTQKSILFTEESRKSCGGHYLRWNGRGIVLNPGPGFLENFHNQRLSIRDIDFVIVTRNNRDAFADVRGISELNHQLNKISPERQIIHYYLHQRVCQELSPFLKPSFKQARNTIHKLEMYLDSPDVEKIELDEGIFLHYFQTSMPRALQNYRESSDEHSFNNASLGIRLELTNDERKLKLGYLSGLAWSPLLAHHLGHCDLLLTAFGNTNPNDYSKLGYNEDSLGYFGTSTLLEELAPRLMLLTEFGGREGDVRIEVVKKIRSEYARNSSQLSSSLLAGDVGLIVDLNSLNIKCSISEALVAPRDVSVVASSESFGHLRYLSSRYCA